MVPTRLGGRWRRHLHHSVYFLTLLARSAPILAVFETRSRLLVVRRFVGNELSIGRPMRVRSAHAICATRRIRLGRSIAIVGMVAAAATVLRVGVEAVIGPCVRAHYATFNRYEPGDDTAAHERQLGLVVAYLLLDDAKVVDDRLKEVFE